MRSFLLSVLLTLLTPAVVWAEPPRPHIVGPTDGQPGDLIDLDGSESVNATLFAWDVEPARFSDGRKTFRVSEDGKRITVASRAMVYTVRLMVANDEAIAVAKFVVIITAPAPPPGTPQVQPPTIPPAQPPGTPPVQPPALGLRDWVSANLPALVRTDTNRATNSHDLADVYRKFSTAGAAASSPAQFVQFSAALVGQFMLQRGIADAWDPFLRALAERVVALRLTTVPQYGDAWREIADGLDR